MDREMSAVTRAVVLRLDEEENLLECLRAAIRDEGARSAWVRAVGTLRTAELVGMPPRRRVDLVQLSGRIDLVEGGTLFAVISDRGALSGGRLVSGVAERIEARLDLEEDGAASETVRSTSRSLLVPADDEDDDDEEHVADAPSSRPSAPVSWADVAAASMAQASAPTPAREAKAAPPRPRSEPSSGPSWADAVAASAEGESRTVRRAAAAEVLPQRGDFIHHRQFGLCRVDREDGNGNVVLRLPSGVRKKIALAFMDVGAPRMQGDKRVFAIRPRKG